MILIFFFLQASTWVVKNKHESFKYFTNQSSARPFKTIWVFWHVKDWILKNKFFKIAFVVAPFYSFIFLFFIRYPQPRIKVYCVHSSELNDASNLISTYEYIVCMLWLEEISCVRVFFRIFYSLIFKTKIQWYFKFLLSMYSMSNLIFKLPNPWIHLWINLEHICV